MTSNVLRDLPFIRDQPLKLADDWYIRILKNKRRQPHELKNNQLRPYDLNWVRDHVAVCMYINAATDSVTLQLYVWRDICNIVFKTIHTHTYSHPPPPTPKCKKSGCAPAAARVGCRSCSWSGWSHFGVGGGRRVFVRKWLNECDYTVPVLGDQAVYCLTLPVGNGRLFWSVDALERSSGSSLVSSSSASYKYLLTEAVSIVGGLCLFVYRFCFWS
jgi:hypothetical protein